jgi:hypothetical protein
MARKDIDLFSQNWEILDLEGALESCAPITICAGHEDLATIYSSEDATVNISRDQAIKAARLFCNAADLAATLEMLVDAVSADPDFRQQCFGQIEQAQRVLSRAYGASA